MRDSTATKGIGDAVGGKFSRTSGKSMLSRFVALVAVFGLVANVAAQNNTRTFDVGAGHIGEGGGLIEINGTLFSGAQDGKIKVWDISNGQLIRTINGFTWVGSFCIVGPWLFSGGRENVVRQWTLPTLQPVRTLTVGIPNNNVWVSSLECYNNVVYSGSNSNGGSVIIAWNPETGAEIRRFTGHTNTVRALAFNGNTMYSGAEDNTIRMWDLTSVCTTCTTSTTLSPTGLWINCMVIANNRLYASGYLHFGGRVREWMLDGTYVREIINVGTTSSLGSIRINGDSIITSSYDGLNLYTLNPSSAATFQRTLLSRYTYNTGNAGNTFYSVSSDGCSIRRWNWTDFSIMWAVPPNYGWSATTTDGTSLWAGRNNGEIWQYTIATGELVRVLAGHTAGISQLVLAGNSLFSGCHDSTAKQWSVTTGALIRTYVNHTNAVTGIAVQNSNLFTASFDRSVVVWNLNNGNIIRYIPNVMNEIIYGISVARNFLVAGAGSGDPRVRVWDWTNSTFLYSINSFTISTFNVFLRETSTGSIHLFVTDWANVRQFDLVTRAHIRTFLSPTALCSLLVVQNSVFAGSCYYGPHTTRQWDITTGTVVRTLAPIAVGMSSFGSSIFMADNEGALRQINIPELVATPPSIAPPDNVIDPDVVATTPVQPTPEPGTNNGRSNGRASASASSSLLNNGVVIPVAASGVFLGAVLAFAAIRTRNDRTKRFTEMATMTSTYTTTTATEVTSMTQQLPNITSITSMIGTNNAEMTSAAGATVNQTAVTQTFEVSIPVFLEMRWGLDYRQEEFLAKGGGGSIYRATCLEFELAERCKNQPLAVKNVAEALETMDDKTRTAFFQEISLMHRFRDHPNFIRLYAYSTRPVAMVMKMYELGDLMHFIAGRGAAVKRGIPYTKLTMVSLTRQFANAIGHMHNSGIVHCDIKPANVLLDVDEKGGLMAILTDFGISRIVDKSAMKVEAFNASDLRGASLAYASPESLVRFRKRLVESDGKIWMAADAYALAISILQMLIRTTPWRK